MAFLTKLPLKSSRFRFASLQITRNFSPSSATPLSGKEKTRSALARLKSEKDPETILDICRDASLTPDSHLDRIVFSVAISKLTQSNYFDGIRLFLQELQTRPDLKTERFASHAIILYGQAGLLDDAVKVFDRMPEVGIRPTVKSLNALLFSCIIAKDYGEVKRVFTEFPKKYGIEPDLDTYNTVIKAFSEFGSSTSVYSILDEMDRKGCMPTETTFGTWIAGFYEEEKLDDVEKVLELMWKHEMIPGIGIYNIRIQSLCKLKKSVEGKALVPVLLSSGINPNSVTYGHLIHGFCKEGDLEEAKNLLKEMINGGCEPDSYCYFTLLHFLCQGGDFEAALQICKESMVKDWIPNFSTMKSLVYGLASISKVYEALELVWQMKEKFPKFAGRWKEIEESLLR